MSRPQKLVSWKSVLAVFLLAFALRWGMGHWQQADQPAEAPGLTQVPGDEEAGPPQPKSAPSGPDEAADEEENRSGPFVFENYPIEVRPRPEDEQVETTFTFVNGSDKPVTVTNMESTCSCLEASLDKATYAPGEKGTGKAVFKVSSFVGRHEKTLHLQLDDPAKPEQVVDFVLDVPAVVVIEPNLLEWTVGQEPTAKEMTFKMVGEEPLHITKITPTRENVRYELKEITSGREYRLIVTPTTTADITVGAFKVETDSKIPKYARQMAFFSIVRPELAEKKRVAASQHEGTSGQDKPVEAGASEPVKP